MSSAIMAASLSGSLHVWTLPAVSRPYSTNAEASLCDRFYGKGTSSSAKMAASRVALKRLSSLLLFGSPRQVTLSAASRSGSHRPGTLLAASHSYSTDVEASFFERFYAECDPKLPNLPPFVHHEYKLDKRGDGLHFRLYMAGVGKGNVKLWIEGGELIAQGIKDKGFEDNDGTSIVIRYKMLSPPDEIFNLDGIKAEINNGMLKVFVPRRKPEVFDPTEQHTTYYNFHE